MAFKRLRSFLFLTFLLFLFFAGSVLLLNSLSQNPSVQDYLLKQLSDIVGYDIQAKEIQVLYWNGVGIRARDFEICSSEGDRKLFASRIRLTLSLRELIRGHLAPTGLTLVAPQIELTLSEDGQLSASTGQDFLAKTPLKTLAAFPSVTLERAHISVKGLPLISRSMRVRMTHRGSDPSIVDITLNGKIDYQGEQIPLSASGTITSHPKTGISALVKLKAQNIPLVHVHLPDLPVKAGTAALNITAAGSVNGPLSAKGRITLDQLDFAIIDDGDKKAFSFDRLLLPFEASYHASTLHVPFLQVRGPGFTLDTTSKLHFRDGAPSQLKLSVEAAAMELKTFHRIFPSSLLPQWVDKELFPIFSDGNVRVEHFSLDGQLAQIANLDIPENAGALELRLDCSDLTAFKDAGGITVEKISGRLAIEDGGIRASSIEARFSNSTLQGGTLDLNSLYLDDPAVRVTANGTFRIEDILKQKDLPLIPDEVRQHLDRFSSAAGNIHGAVEVAYEPGWPYPKVLRGELTFRDCSMMKKAVVFPAILEQGKLRIEADGNRRFTVKGRWGGSALTATGQIGASWETGKADIKAEADMGELVGHFHPALRAAIHFHRNVPCRLTLVKKEQDWQFAGSLDLKNVSLETDAMTVEPFGVKGDVGFSGELRPGTCFYIRDLRCNLGPSSFGLAGTYDLAGEGCFDLHVFSKKLRLQDLGTYFKKGNLKGKGSLAFDATVQGSRFHPMMTAVTGHAQGRDLFFATSEFPHPVEECNFTLTANGKDIQIGSLDLKLGQNPFHIEGELLGWNGMRGDLTIRSDFLDLSDLLCPELLARFQSRPPVFPNLTGDHLDPSPAGWRAGARTFLRKSDIHLNITAPQGQWEGLAYGPLKMECALRSGDLYISRSSAAWEHGKLRLRGHVKRGKPPDMLFSGYLDITKQPLGELPPALNFITSRTEGQLTLEALLFAKGTGKKNLLSNLSGSVNILLEQGVLKKSHVLFKILEFMSLQRMFEKRPSGLSKEGLYFESIGARVDLKNGLARGTDVSMRSPVFNAAAVGKANLNTATVDAEIGIQPLGTLDALVSSVPVAGYLLTGDRKALYVDYFKVDGSLSDPNVQYIPLKSLGNGTVGFLTRVLLSPQRVFKRISDAVEEFEGNGYPIPDEHLKPEKDMGG